MKFEIEKEAMQGLIAIFGKEHATNEVVAGYRAALEAAVEELEQEINNG